MPLTDAQITRKVGQLRRTEGKVYAPLKYFRGLETLKEVETRYKKMLKRDYTKFRTDEGRKTKTSSYTQKFRKRYPGVKSLPDIAKATGIPLKTVKTIYNRGLAAWRTGHRPGASPQAWGYARVHSFATKGKTYYTADKPFIYSLYHSALIFLCIFTTLFLIRIVNQPLRVQIVPAIFIIIWQIPCTTWNDFIYLNLIVIRFWATIHIFKSFMKILDPFF